MPGLSQRVIFSLFSSSMLPPRSPRRCKRASSPYNTVLFQTYHRSKPRNGPLPTAVPEPGKSPALRGFVAGAPGFTTAVLYPSTKIERPKSGRHRPQRGGFRPGGALPSLRLKPAHRRARGSGQATSRAPLNHTAHPSRRWLRTACPAAGFQGGEIRIGLRSCCLEPFHFRLVVRIPNPKGEVVRKVFLAVGHSIVPQNGARGLLLRTIERVMLWRKAELPGEEMPKLMDYRDAC